MREHKFTTRIRMASRVLLLLVLSINVSIAQSKYVSKASTVKIDGTSSLHAWNMTSNSGDTQAIFSIKDGKITGISSLTVTVDATSLKSSRSGLDKNAYKALNTSKGKTITYKMSSGTVTPSGANYVIKTEGTLTIAGVSKPLTLTSTVNLNANNSIAAKGSTKFKMSTYGVKPPTVMMGTIKTGDEITLTYETLLNN